MFIYFIIPLFESILSFLSTWLKYKETYYSAETYKMSKRASKEVEEDAKVIGFVYDEEDPEEDET